MFRSQSGGPPQGEVASTTVTRGDRYSRSRGLMAIVLATLIASVATVVPARPVAAAANNALQFNGTSQYVTMGTALGLNAATFTIETWFNWTGAGTANTTGTGGIMLIPLMAKGAAEVDNHDNRDEDYILGISKDSAHLNVLAADFEEGAAGANPSQNHPVYGSTAITANTWHHAAATYDGTTWKLYLDGALDATLVVGQPTRSDSIQPFALGTMITSAQATPPNTPQGFFAGVLDEARVWNSARTQAQIQATKDVEISVPTTGLLGRWGLNEGTGTSAADSSGHAINGTLTGGPTWVAGFPGTSTGFLRVSTNPALPAQISLNGVVADSWGLTWVKVTPGSYTVHFSHIEGYTEPADQVVSVTAGNTTTVTGTFTQRGSLRVITSPAVAGTVSVDGVPRNDWGMWSDIPTGAHQVCFGAVAGYNPPACQNITVNAGSLTTVTGTYEAPLEVTYRLR